MNGRFLTAVAGVALLAAAGGAVWLLGGSPGEPARPADRTAAAAASPDAAAAPDPRLASIIDAATATAAQAKTDAESADSVAAAADDVAAKAASFAAEGKAAAEKAVAAAAKACKSPGAAAACATAADGTRYEGGQACRADGCGPESYGVFTDAARGWESQGLWKDWFLVLGCDSMKGVVTYCGQQAASAWTGYGISYNAEAAAISAEWLKGAGKNPIQLDYPTGSRMRGEMADYILDGLGVYERNDGRVLRGRWRAGKLVSGVVAFPGGDSVSGAFADGLARSGVIAYRDGRRFVGALEDGPTLAQPMPAAGLLYAPDGKIEKQLPPPSAP